MPATLSAHAPQVSDRLGSYHVPARGTAAYWLSPMERSQLVKQGVPAREVVALADAMVREAGEAPDDFDAAHWFARWMADPVPALGGLAPQELLDTADGREAISTLLYQMKSGVYA